LLAVTIEALRDGWSAIFQPERSANTHKHNSTRYRILCGFSELFNTNLAICIKIRHIDMYHPTRLQSIPTQLLTRNPCGAKPPAQPIVIHHGPLVAPLGFCQPLNSKYTNADFSCKKNEKKKS
jgi:hypothetical protein